MEKYYRNILDNKEKYEIYPIYIDKSGEFWEYKDKLEPREFGKKIEQKEKIENIFEYLKNVDVVFPVLHGLYGEDGTIQGMLEMLKIPYVGCHVLASSVGMDKVYAKVVFEKAGINQVKHEYVRKYKDKYIYIDNISICAWISACERDEEDIYGREERQCNI